VVVAKDGPEALECLLGSGAGNDVEDLPEVVLLDLKLPKVDGLEVLERIKLVGEGRPARKGPPRRRH
jgi:two-component system response regulator